MLLRCRFFLVLACLGLLASSASAVSPPPFILSWGSSGSGDGQFNQTIGCDVDAAGDVYVVDHANNRIQKFTSTGGFITKWGSSGTGPGQFHFPGHLAVDGSGNVFVADQGPSSGVSHHRIQKFTSTGTFVAEWGSFGSGDGQFHFPIGVAVDANGDVYVADFSNHRVQKFSNGGAFIAKWGSFGAGDGQFNHPRDVAVDGDGDIYVLDRDNSRIQKFTSSGAFIEKWGSSGSGDGQLNGPLGIAVDAHGRVYVADTQNERVQVFADGGAYLVEWGTPGTGNGQFDDPAAIALDAAGDIYVCDRRNSRVQKFGALPAQPNCVDPPAGLVSWWPGDGDVADIRGTNSGSLTNGAGFAAGQVAEAFSLDGVDDFVEVGDAVELSFGTGPLTVDAWLKDTSMPAAAGGGVVTKCAGAGTGPGYQLFIFSGGPLQGHIEAFLTDGTTNLSAVSSTAVSDGTFHHVAMTWDTATLTLYVDGVLEASATGTLGSTANIRPVVIGHQKLGPAGGPHTLNPFGPFEGLIDEVEIFDRALAPSEILDIVNAGSAGKCKDPAVPLITVDATALSPQPTSIFGVGGFPSDTPTDFELSPGFYSFRGAGNAFTFEVTPSGTVDFDVSLDGFLSGRGSTTLVVSAFTITIDSSALSPQPRSIFNVSESVDVPLTLIPGTYSFRGAGNAFTFQVTNSGAVEFDTSLDGFLSGRGTSVLTVSGFVITIDSAVLSALPRSIFNVAQSVDDPFTLIPGTYSFKAGSGNMTFQLGNDGFVSGLPSVFQGFSVSGNGNTMIVIGAVTVSVSGTVSSDCQGALQGVTVGLLVAGEYFPTYTDALGNYSIADVPGGGTGEISIVVPIGFVADVPTEGDDTIDLSGDLEDVNFSLLCIPSAGEARSKGYWKHQASVYVKNKGTAQESEDDMRTTFPNALFNHFHENQLASIEVDGITHTGGGPVSLETILETLKKKGSMLDKAKQQYMALLLNMASGKVLSLQIVSADGATASQAIQDVADMINDGASGNDELAKDIAEAISHGELVAAGVIDLSYPNVAYARPQFVDVPLRVSPNPGGAQNYTFSFAVPRAGRATLEIFNVAGRRIATPFSDVLATGRREITWNGRTAIGSRIGYGVYFARLTTPAGAKSVKFVHLGR